MKPARTIEELKELYEEELLRKDKIIASLREENKILLKTALKASKDRLEKE